MSLKALTIEDVARELGRSPSWLYEHWQQLVTDKKIPPPLIERGGMTWSAAQFYAFQDRHLTVAQRIAAAAYRAAHDAATAITRGDIETNDQLIEARRRLDDKLARRSGVAG